MDILLLAPVHPQHSKHKSQLFFFFTAHDYLLISGIKRCLESQVTFI